MNTTMFNGHSEREMLTSAPETLVKETNIVIFTLKVV